MKEKVSLFKDKAFLGALLLCFVAAAVLIVANYYDIQQKKNDNYVDLNNVAGGGSQLAEVAPEAVEEDTTATEDEMFGLDNVMDATDEVKQIDEAEMEAVSGNSVQNDDQNYEEVSGTAPGDAQSVSGNAVNNTVENISFDENTIMKWPIEGEVVKPYHMDSMLYFETLDQYKYNPAMLISGSEGDSIVAAAAGKVVEVHETDETGLTVEMDLGDGYRAVYGQLASASVSTGQTVEEGAIIGTLSAPTRYYTLEGTHLYFELRKDGNAINPEEYLQ